MQQPSRFSGSHPTRRDFLVSAGALAATPLQTVAHPLRHGLGKAERVAGDDHRTMPLPILQRQRLYPQRMNRPLRSMTARGVPR
jgi:hypothetical protein